MKINKLVGSLAAMTLLANLAASSVVLATEGVEPEPVELSQPTDGIVENAKIEEATYENLTTGYSEELLSEFSEKVTFVDMEIRSSSKEYTTESRAKARSLRREAIRKVGPNQEAGTLTDEIIREGIQLLDLALASLVLEQPETPETPKPETSTPENPKQEQPKEETPTPEQPKPQEPKPKEETPKAETTTDEVAPQPKAESNKPALPNTGNTEATAKPKDMTMEKPVSTTSATQIDNKQLPQTGEADSFAIFSAAALTILAGVGMLAYGKREEA
ncbi:LPXTG cell wall anchor domain-containing protein [Aerococcaceae bacterium NML190073]|nr:LPXTG cell wall anchor domain-containing protein [Aerococcaceae bacterium NML190073]